MAVPVLGRASDAASAVTRTGLLSDASANSLDSATAAEHPMPFNAVIVSRLKALRSSSRPSDGRFIFLGGGGGRSIDCP